MKIAFFEVEEWEIAHLKQELEGHTLAFFPGPLAAKDIKQLQDVDIISVFIYSTLSADVLKELPSLKLIVTRSTGFDHIDIAYAAKHNIIVSNVPNYGANTVAEHTFALLLALSRKLVPSIERTRRGNFELEGLRGFDLHGKTIGVIGVGHIGTEVIRMAKGFGMHVVAYSRHPDEALARRMHVTFLRLPELLRVADVITLHVPYTKQTRHIINKRNIKKLKKGSILINTARGGLIETEAILYALDKGLLQGVGLDVLEEECGIKEERQLLAGKFKQECDLRTQLLNHVLLAKDNVLITPHNAFNSNEALQKILDVTVEDIVSFEKKKPHNTVS